MSDGVRLSVYAAGFNYKYASDEVEVRALLGEDNRSSSATRELRAAHQSWRPNSTGDRERVWRPSTPDFQAEAMRKPPAKPAATFGSFLAAIRGYKQLNCVEFYGEGSPDRIGFGSGGGHDMLGLRDTPEKLVSVFGSFAPGGAIHFYTSNSSLSGELLRLLAYKLGVRVVGYSGVKYTLQFTGSTPARKITGRGMDRQAKLLSTTVDPPRRLPTANERR